ncbi:M10 family metallopeptidase [Pseudomonas fluorescens]|uniref:M10 family metallopeptidase C-terminal domain-containing protein n=1 Tax=Pseudomonas fluorescens TaxID=294 RepID=UPI00178686FE|nr:M10 family metallopeptidase C-terminal domain-containing protein [Pseudomonas fluorescens]MBD8097375.1 M10 family metallopeptidase [Pseudomonas fluorescens]MBD8773347.1 M10 family metallopeptidase [Pseudomonas fluorescens]MBD8777680.1 M10 family metallopeptidase [Pseudomonas fluorescens]MBD8794282.1 M10 family metallopeptidase [Pseudomonas fluorescens]
MKTVASLPSDALRLIEAFRHRDDRGGDIRHNGLPSKSAEDAASHLWRKSPGWPDKNGDGRYDVTYEFRTPPVDKNARQLGKTGFTHTLENQRQQTRLSMQSIADVANVRFTEGPRTAASEGHITLGNFGQRINGKGQLYNDTSYAVLPAPGVASSGDIWFAVSKGNTSVVDAALGNAGRYTIVHELGHALGLAHTGDYDRTLTKEQVGYHEDSQSHSAMSYRGERTGYMNHAGMRASAPQLDDISAYQRKYGANHDTRKDDTTYGFNANSDRDFLSVNTAKDKMVAAIWDGGGNDTLDFSGYTQLQRISLREGTFSDVGGLKGNVSIADGAMIENAIGGSGNDLMVGNEVANELKGGEGDDWLYGAEGADTLWGGKGKDLFAYGRASDSTQAAPDRIMDFVSGEDRVDVSGVRASLGIAQLTFVDAFSGAMGEAMLTYNPVLKMSSLEICAAPNEPNFVLSVEGQLQRSDIVS